MPTVAIQTGGTAIIGTGRSTQEEAGAKGAEVKSVAEIGVVVAVVVVAVVVVMAAQAMVAEAGIANPISS